MRAISSHWATPTAPSACAVAQSGRASWRRAVCTRRWASGPDSLHMCLTTVFAEKNPCGRNGLCRSTAPAAAMAVASTERRSSSMPTSHARISIASRCDRSTSPSAATAASACPQRPRQRVRRPVRCRSTRPAGAGSRRDGRPPTAFRRRRRPRSAPLDSYLHHDEGVSHTWENVVVRSFDAGLTPGVADRSLCPDSDLSAGVGRSGYAPAGRGGP